MRDAVEMQKNGAPAARSGRLRGGGRQDGGGPRAAQEERRNARVKFHVAVEMVRAARDAMYPFRA